MIRRLFIFIILLLNSVFIFSQSDTLLELSVNNTIRTFYNENLNNPNSPYLLKNRKIDKSITILPFLDDFSQSSFIPNPECWVDLNVYINSSFPIDPITYGVATFDGLDSTGTPYNFSNPTSYGQADVLTSQVVDLSSVIDSVYLSFYYQPQGNGNRPENQDSLRLEFFRNSDSTWIRMWGVTGSTSHPFRRVMIPVDTNFHNNAFRFRFMNYATLSGNVDHWNLDYVYLNDERTSADTVLNDVSYITNHHNLLSEFTAMPWDHYQIDTSENMSENLSVEFRNNNNSIHNLFYNYEVIDDNGAGPSLEISPPFIALINDNVNPGEIKLIDDIAVFDVSPILRNDFFFPPDNEVNKVFEIKNFFRLNGIPDSLQRNDTVVSQQIFGSYYAYDDGSAEVGYGVQGPGSRLAHEFNIKKSDTLTALQIYFSPIANNLSASSFKLTVWSSLVPETILYQQQNSFESPIYSSTNKFLNYELETPLLLAPGTYYFGWEKISPEFLNVGWDLNTNNKNKVHFNAIGVWQTASFNGSLMLRPVFGNTGDPITSIEDKEEIILNDDFKVFPNPVSHTLNFERIGAINNSSYRIELVDIYGKFITSTTTDLNNQLDVSNFSDGIYLIRFINNDNQYIITKKIIISK